MAELHRQSSAGVKSLRAMFENSAPTSPSPDSRGRSVSGNSSNSSQTIDRPLSKVRSSFIAVEKMQMISPSASIKDRERRGSFSLSQETEVDAIQEIHKVVSEEQESRKSSKEVGETVPEQAVESAQAAPTPVATPLLAAVGKKPSLQPKRQEKMAAGVKGDKPQACSKSKAAPEPASKESPLQQPTSSEPEPLRNGGKSDPIESPAQSTGHPSSHVPLNGASERERDSSETHAPSNTVQASQMPPNATPIPVTEQRASPENPPHPTPVRTTKPSTTRTPSTQRNDARNRQPSRTASARSSLASNTTLPGTIDRGIGFVKPRPKSPTRPLKLPAHLVAPTASSAAKLRASEIPAGPLSPKANGTPGLRASTSGLRSRRESAVERARPAPAPAPAPAWGPPPKKKVDGEATKKKGVVEGKAVKEPDKGFLERMMRPTASSAAKERGGGLGK